MLEKIVNGVKIGIITSALTVGGYACSTTKRTEVNYPIVKGLQRLNQEMECYENKSATEKECHKQGYPLLQVKFN